MDLSGVRLCKTISSIKVGNIRPVHVLLGPGLLNIWMLHLKQFENCIQNSLTYMSQYSSEPNHLRPNSKH